jgi:hypothetical protein
VETFEHRGEEQTMKGLLWVGAAVLLLAGAVALMLMMIPPRPGSSTPAENEPPPDKLQVLSLDVEHHATVNGCRDPREHFLGKDFFVTHCDDGVEVEVRLSRPAYAFLIAFRPDGSEFRCLPEKEDERPPRTDRLRYPPAAKDDYGLEEGAGLHAFAVVASSQPLPPWKEWWPRQGSPWRKNETPPEGVWRAINGTEVEELTADPSRSRGRKEVPDKAAVQRLTDWLATRPQVETLGVLGFPVLPKEKP